MNLKSKTKFVLLAGILVIAVSFINGKAVPIYDGLGQPDEPYRYVAPPASQKNPAPPPTDANETFTPDKINGDINGVFIVSKESGPQISFNLSQNSVIFSAGAKSVNFKAEPLAPTDQPNDGTIDGNVYRLTMTPDGGSVSFAPNSSSVFKYVDMRLPQNFPPGAIIEHKPETGSGWQKLQTNQVGQDIYEARFEQTGDFAMVTPHKATGSNGQKHKNKTPLYIGEAAIVVAIAAVIIAIRYMNRQDKA